MKTIKFTLPILLAAAVSSQAANISLTASDVLGATSFNAAGKWSNVAAPSGANDYYTGSFFMRTPTDAGNLSYTFAGNSLTLQQPGASVVRSVIVKSGGNDIFTINNLTNALGGVLENGGSGNVVTTFTGNQYTIAANSAIMANQGSLQIGYPIVGASGVVLTNGGANVNGITYNNTLSGFKGILYLSLANFGNGGGNTKVILNAAGSVPGNPTSFTPNQIWITAGCTLQDNLGQTFNNANGGFLLNGPGTANINAAANTIISVPITDATNGVSSLCALNMNGVGTLTLSGNNSYAGGTTISSGSLQIGSSGALTNNGAVTANAMLDLNGNSITINTLAGAGAVDTLIGGTPTLTLGNGNGNATFTGSIQNASGTLSVTKIGTGTQTLSGSYTYSGTMLVAGGTLVINNPVTVPTTPGNIVISNNATLTGNVSGGVPLAASSITVGTNTTLNLTLLSTATGINGSGNLTLQDNATNNFTFVGALTVNPSAPVINVAGGISVGSGVVINLAATGLKTGTFTLIKYGTGTLASVAGIVLNPPPGVAATLVNNTGNQSVDVNITSTPSQISWTGVAGSNWDLSSANWSNISSATSALFQQYTNGSVIAGDSVLFDDTVTNDFSNPQPTNITLATRFFAFPVLVNSTLPYSISGSGGIAGVTSFVKANTGSLSLLTSNNFTGGVNLAGGTLIITNDSALGASSGAVTLNSGTLQINGSLTNSRAHPMPVTSTIGVGSGVTARLNGVISGGGTFNKADSGTLTLAAVETFTGSTFLHGGLTVIDTGGSITNGSYHDVGQNGSDTATLTLKGTSSFGTTSDFNVGDIDNAAGVLNIQDTATLTMNAFFIGSANAVGSTASGIVNQSGGTVTEISTGVGTFCIGGRTSVSGLGVYNMSGGTLNANGGIRIGSTGIGTLNQSGGTINAKGGINIARIAGSFGTNNLNGGVLSTLNIATSTSTNAVFNFNGGLLQANFTPGNPWFSAGIQANILTGGAFIDSSNNSVAVNAPLLAGSANGGLTKRGTGTLTLNGVNTFTGSITNTAGTLVLNSASTYAGGLSVNAGIVQFSSATVFQGPTIVSNAATLAVTQVGSTPVTISNLTLNGAPSGGGSVLSLTPGAANNPAVAMLNCGTLTLNSTNTMSIAAVNIGTFALVKYTGAIAGSGNCTNLTLPQGATGFVSNSVANATLYAVITSTGPGLVWTGTNAAALNSWDINLSTNWTVSGVPTSYHQIISPGDSVLFNDIGSGTVLLNTNAAPASVIISNNVKVYTFSGTGGISGPSSLLKVGTGTAILNLTNDTYVGNTIISNGTLQVVNYGVGSSLSPTANLTIGSSGTLSLSAQQANVVTRFGELTGAGVINYSGGFNSILNFGGNTGGTWNGSIRDAGGGGLSLTKTGSGTWVIGGTNYFNNGDGFFAASQAQLNGGTTILTNNSWISTAVTEFWIAQGAGSTSTVVVAGGTLAVSNSWLCVGRGDATANGTLIVNSGTVLKTGNNTMVIGSLGATGTLIVNGGQVLDNNEMLLGESPSSVANLYLNGGLIQATDIKANNNGGFPIVPSVAYLNGGTVRANTNVADFIQVSSQVMSNGFTLDDNGYSVGMVSQPFQAGDAFNGGLIKKGSGSLYLDAASTYTGTTLVTNGLLAGIGSVTGPVVVAPAGTIGAGNAAGNGAFSINNNLTIQGGSFMRINKTGGTPAQDQVVVSGNITYGGVLVVSNITSDATVLVTGDTFPLFSVTGTKTGNFSSIVGTPGVGLLYSFNPTTGVLSVAPSVNTTPTNLVAVVSGNTLTLSWPADHLGWRLQVQTNSIDTGVSGNWSDVAGSTSVNTVNATINPANGAVFYRMVYP